MKTTKGQLGSYQMMIASKYFETIEDFENLEIATKKAEGNMEKFHFNPIPLTDYSRKFFTRLETLHVYGEKDNHFWDEEFYARVFWYEVDYDRMRRDEENYIYKNVVLKHHYPSRREVPERVTKIGKYCFDRYESDEEENPGIIENFQNQFGRERERENYREEKKRNNSEKKCQEKDLMKKRFKEFLNDLKEVNLFNQYSEEEESQNLSFQIR